MRQNRGHVSLIGRSPSIVALRAEIERVASSNAKVLITGESGVGKEVVAREIHAHSPRASQAFVPINCAGIPETLLESELFGHVKGSFTGAFRDKLGRLEMANGGTMFMDEIGEMSLRMQGLLLRFMETGEMQKVGAERVSMVGNVRVLSATNRNLRERIAEGAFREDLYYRLNVIHLVIPPLRERPEDIPELVQHFLKRQSEAINELRVWAISPEALDILCQYSWPGNVRELENVLERLMVVSRTNVIDVGDLAHEIRAVGSRPVSHRKERRRTIADDLFKTLVEEGKPFWTSVYPLYMNREIARKDMRDLVHIGLKEARGNYRIVLRLFNMESRDYKRFLNFLRKHDCRLPFKKYRQAS